MFERILYQNIDLHGMIYSTGLVNELLFHWQQHSAYRLMQMIKMLQADKSVLICTVNFNCQVFVTLLFNYFLLSLNALCPKAIRTTMYHNNLLFCARTSMVGQHPDVSSLSLEELSVSLSYPEVSLDLLKQSLFSVGSVSENN